MVFYQRQKTDKIHSGKKNRIRKEKLDKTITDQFWDNGGLCRCMLFCGSTQDCQ